MKKKAMLNGMPTIGTSCVLVNGGAVEWYAQATGEEAAGIEITSDYSQLNIWTLTPSSIQLIMRFSNSLLSVANLLWHFIRPFPST